MGWPVGFVLMAWTLLNVNEQIPGSGRYYLWGAANLGCIAYTLMAFRRDRRPDGMHWVIAVLAAVVYLVPAVFMSEPLW